MLHRYVGFLLYGLTLFTAPVCAVELVREGQAVGSIVLPAEPSKQETAAAHDLQSYIEKMSGAMMPIVHEPDMAQGPAVMIGHTTFAQTHIGDRLTRKNLGHEGYILQTVGDRLIVAGLAVPYLNFRLGSGDGTRHGVFDVLERLGCRFFTHNEDGEHVPTRTAPALPTLEIIAKPDFEMRRLGFSSIRKKQTPEQQAAFKAWCIKNRLGGPHYPTFHNY